MGKTDEEILKVLKASGTPLTLVEIAEKSGKKPKVVFRALRKLFGQNKIRCDMKTRRYAAQETTEEGGEDTEEPQEGDN